MDPFRRGWRALAWGWLPRRGAPERYLKTIEEMILDFIKIARLCCQAKYYNVYALSFLFCRFRQCSGQCAAWPGPRDGPYDFYGYNNYKT
jgi:hypothetical protein